MGQRRFCAVILWVVSGVCISLPMGGVGVAGAIENPLALPGEQPETGETEAEKPPVESLAALEERLQLLLSNNKGKHSQESLHVMGKIGKAKKASGDMAGVANNYQEMLKGAQEVYGKDHPSTGSIHKLLGYLKKSSNPAAAAEHTRIYVEIGRKTLQPMMTLAEQSAKKQDLFETKRLYQQALDFSESYSGKKSSWSLMVASRYADFLSENKETGGMKRLLREYYPIAEELLAEDDPLRSNMLEQYARVSSTLGDVEKAMELYKKALERAEKKPGSEQLRVVAHNYALILEESSQLEEAERQMLRALEIARKEDGKGNRERLAKNLNNLGRITSKQNRFDRSIAYYQEACDIAKGGSEQNMELLAMESCGNVGEALYAQGKLKEAAVKIRETLPRIEKALGGRDKPNYFISMRLLSEINKKMGNNKEADALLAEAKALEDRFKRQHSRLGLKH